MTQSRKYETAKTVRTGQKEFQISLRQSLSAAVTLLATMPLMVALGISIWTTGAKGGSRGFLAAGQWYFDTDTGRLFMADLDQTPPSIAPSGGQGVWAHVGTCKTCCSPGNLEGMTPVEIEKFGFSLGYLKRIGSEGHKQLALLDPTTKGTVTGTRVRDGIAKNRGQIRLLNTPDTEWLDRSDELTGKVIGQLKARCKGQVPRQCHPRLTA